MACEQWSEQTQIPSMTHLLPARNVLGGTALHGAADGGHLACCQLLASVGASLRAEDDFGYRPLRKHSDVCMVV